MQSLYLFPDRPACLELDGPSLLLTVPGLAPRRYPLRRVSHIVLGGTVQVEARTLATCLERRISLAFIHDSSGLAGIALPSVPETPSSSLLVERLLSTPDWRVHYANWLSASARAHLLKALNEAGLPPPTDSRNDLVRQMWQRRLVLHGLTPDEVRAWIAFDHALLGARCALLLSEDGVQPSALAAGPILAPDEWISVLGWHSYTDLEWLVSRLGPMLNRVRQNWRRRLTEFAETRAPNNDRRIRAFWSDFLAFASLRIQKSRVALAAL